MASSGSTQHPMALDERALIGRTIGHRYRIDTVLGRGSTSIVFRAHHLELDSPVAMKVLAPLRASDWDDDLYDRFRFEAQVLADLRHPNVITIFDLGQTEEGLRYLVMELLRGETLATLLQRSGRLAVDLAVDIACQTAEALAVLHERGLVHRDVKPANIFLAEGAESTLSVKLMDFGLVRMVDSVAFFARGEPSGQGGRNGPRRRQHTADGLIVGTAAYMSPELIHSNRLDARSDIYALGVVTYRMLTGTPPFEGEDLPQLLARHLLHSPESLRKRAPQADISEALEKVVLRALRKEPEERPASARQFALELSRAIDCVTLRPPTLPTRSPDVYRAAPPELAAGERASDPTIFGRARRTRPNRTVLVRTLLAAVLCLGAGLGVYALGGRGGSVAVGQQGTLPGATAPGSTQAPQAQSVSAARADPSHRSRTRGASSDGGPHAGRSSDEAEQSSPNAVSLLSPLSTGGPRPPTVRREPARPPARTPAGPAKVDDLKRPTWSE